MRTIPPTDDAPRRSKWTLEQSKAREEVARTARKTERKREAEVQKKVKGQRDTRSTSVPRSRHRQSIMPLKDTVLEIRCRGSGGQVRGVTNGVPSDALNRPNRWEFKSDSVAEVVRYR